jgi:hypothetical protein
MPQVCAVERRLSSAAALWLTYEGRLTYVNSAITPLVTFAMCTLKITVKFLSFVTELDDTAYGENTWMEKKNASPWSPGIWCANQKASEVLA